jgi:hypothetical protein
MRFKQNCLRLIQGLHLQRAYFTSLLILLGASTFAWGQGAQDVAREYYFNVVYLSLADSGKMKEEKPLNVKFFADQVPIHLSARSGEVSSYFSHRGAPDLYFYNENGTNEEGEIIYKPALNVDLGASGQKLIFVIEKPDSSLGARVFDMSVDVFPLNTIQVLNFSKVPVMVRLGEEVGGVPSFKNKNFPVEIEQRRSAINFALAIKVNGEPEVVEMKRIAFTKNRRQLILVYNDPSKPAKIRHRIFPIAVPTFVDNRSDEELEAEDYDKYMREYRADEQ